MGKKTTKKEIQIAVENKFNTYFVNSIKKIILNVKDNSNNENRVAIGLNRDEAINKWEEFDKVTEEDIRKIINMLENKKDSEEGI